MWNDTPKLPSKNVTQKSYTQPNYYTIEDICMQFLHVQEFKKGSFHK